MAATSSASISYTVLPGDVDGDGSVTAADVALCRPDVGQPVSDANSRCDVNLDGVVNRNDLKAIQSFIGN